MPWASCSIRCSPVASRSREKPRLWCCRNRRRSCLFVPRCSIQRIAPPVEQVVLRALEKDPQRRFQTPQALATAYQQALHASAPPAPPGTPFPFVLSSGAGATTVAMRPVLQQPAARFPSLRTGSVIAAAAVLLALLLGVVIGFGIAHNTGGNSALPQTPVAHGTAMAKPASTPSPTMITGTCSANVRIDDTADLLNRTQVCEEAKTLPYTVAIYTSKTFPKGDGDFDHLAQSLVTSPSMIVIAIMLDASSPQPHVHVAIFGGLSVPLTDQQYHRAIDVFKREATLGDYTGATIAALQTLHETDEAMRPKTAQPLNIPLFTSARVRKKPSFAVLSHLKCRSGWGRAGYP